MTLEQLNERATAILQRQIGAYQQPYTGLSRDIVNVYREGFRDVENEIAKAFARLENVAPEDYYNELIKYQRLENLERQIRTDMNATLRRVSRLESESGSLAISNRYYLDQYSVNWFTPAAGQNQFFTVLPTEAINVSVYGTPEVWADIPRRRERRLAERGLDLRALQPKHGTLTSVIQSNNTQTLNAINRTITQGFIQGKSYTAMTRDLRAVFNTSANNAIRIVRTEGNRNMNAGAYAQTALARDSGVEVRRMIIATLDDRTREQSAKVDGQPENDKGEFEYPGGVMVEIPGNSGVGEWDINDRETVIDFIDGVDPGTRRGVNPSTGESGVANYGSFENWARENGLRRNQSGRLIHETQGVGRGGTTTNRAASRGAA